MMVEIVAEVSRPALVSPRGPIDKIGADRFAQADDLLDTLIHRTLDALGRPADIVSQQVLGQIGRSFKPDATVAEGSGRALE